MIYKRLVPVLFVAVLATACSSTFEVTNVDYSQRLESVLEPDAEGMVTDTRHGISFNIMPFQYQEFNDSTTVNIDQVRLIRNSDGYYFITANNFKHVYVMEPAESKLVQKKRIKITEQGLKEPAFNLRSPYVQLVVSDTAAVYTLNEKGIQSNDKEDQS